MLPSMKLTRREALQTLGALAAAPLVPGCSGSGGPGKISTQVFLMMENRSYDHYLGSRKLLEGKPGDGLTAGMSSLDKDGKPVPIWAATTDGMCFLDPPHDWVRSRMQLDGGKNDGFARAFQDDHPGSDGTTPMAYLKRADVPVLSALADAYTSCDRWFASILTQTLPNRMYWHAATCNGAKSNSDVTRGAFKGVRSLYHNLHDAGVDWAYYYGDAPILAFIEGLDTTGHLRPFMPDFMNDAAAGKLPPVVYIDPAFGANDDHPPHHPLLGQQLIAAVYTALATSPQWKECQLVIAYDEHGGFFDHVPPGKAPDERAADDFGQLGMRVPALVIGPYAKQAHVSSVVRDHTSALKHLENHFNLPALTMRDAAATDLSECIDMERLDDGKPSSPIQLPAVEIDESQLPDSCKSGGDFKPDHDALVWAEENKAMLGDLDRRSYTRDDVYAIAEYLDGFGLGRIRRGR
jgi:phospholipase C